MLPNGPLQESYHFALARATFSAHLLGAGWGIITVIVGISLRRNEMERLFMFQAFCGSFSVKSLFYWPQFLGNHILGRFTLYL